MQDCDTICEDQTVLVNHELQSSMCQQIRLCQQDVSLLLSLQ